MNEIVLSRQVNEHVPKVRWIASLSNGETIFEDNTPGLPSAWRRLGDYVRHNSLAITKVRVQVGPYEVELPPHEEGYIQKHKIGSTGGHTLKSVCVGHVNDGRAVLHQLGEDRSSVTQHTEDPGPPWTIYRHDIPCVRDCCTKDVVKGFVFGNKAEPLVVQRREGDLVYASRLVDGKPARGKPRLIHISEVIHVATES